MPKDDVVFRMTTEEAQAVQGFLRLVDAQKKVDSGAEKASAKMRNLKANSEQAASSVVKWGIGLMGISSATDLIS